MDAMMEELFQQPHKSASRIKMSTWRTLLTIETTCILSILLLLGKVAGERDALLTFKLFYFPLFPPIAMLWLWGFNVGYWTDIRLNYVKVFDVEDRLLLPCHTDIYKMAHVFTCSVLASALVFISCTVLQYDEFAQLQAEMLYFALMLLMFIPGDVIFGKQRKFLLSTLRRIALPFQHVSFADFLLADVLTSLAKPLSDIGQVLFYLLQTYSGFYDVAEMTFQPTSWLFSLFIALPYLWRLAQCIRMHSDTGDNAQLANAVKYSTAIPVIALSTLKYHTDRNMWLNVYKPLWILCAITNSSFSFYWDVAKDWEFHLFSYRSENTILRNDLVYADKKHLYKFAIWSNLLLRITWTLKISAQIRHLYGVSLVISLFEVYRRFQWMFIRIEVALLKELRKNSVAVSSA